MNEMLCLGKSGHQKRESDYWVHPYMSGQSPSYSNTEALQLSAIADVKNLWLPTMYWVYRDYYEYSVMRNDAYQVFMCWGK